MSVRSCGHEETITDSDGDVSCANCGEWIVFNRLESPPKPETICEEANRLTHGDRQSQYGHPLDDFSRTAELWTTLLKDRLLPGTAILSDDVARLMIALKLSRDVNKAKRDTVVDIAGYAQTLQMVRDERERRANLCKAG